jgi:hypothetical protein
VKFCHCRIFPFFYPIVIGRDIENQSFNINSVHSPGKHCRIIVAWVFHVASSNYVAQVAQGRPVCSAGEQRGVFPYKIVLLTSRCFRNCGISSGCFRRERFPEAVFCAENKLEFDGLAPTFSLCRIFPGIDSFLDVLFMVTY